MFLFLLIIPALSWGVSVAIILYGEKTVKPGELAHEKPIISSNSFKNDITDPAEISYEHQNYMDVDDYF